MKKLRRFMLWTAASAALQACEKKDVAPAPTPAEMLTSKPWKLISYGFDVNNNGIVDPAEESIRDCERDNTYIFNIDGSGSVYENTMVCDGNNPANQFTWALKNNDTVLDFFYAAASIVRLSPSDLHIADLSSSQGKLLLVYRH
jgi:hypothetical protein